MKSIWFTICVITAVASFSVAHADSDEPGTSPTPAADPMQGQDTGQVRDDNGLKMKLVWCPPGVVTMGSPPSEQDRDDDENQVGVSLTNGYWLGKYEVTQAEWKQVMGTEPWKDKDFVKESADYPATYISWDDAMQFCRKLTEQELKEGRLPTGWEYTLPTEAQWERACRARTETRFSFGDEESKLGEYAWFDENAFDANEPYAHRVGQMKANPFGLHDMHGNVWEWCRDAYAEKLPGGRDPEVKADEKKDGSYRMYRGGGWNISAANCRSGNRGWNEPDFRGNDFGFRPALSPVWSVQ